MAAPIRLSYSRCCQIFTSRSRSTARFVSVVGPNVESSHATVRSANHLIFTDSSYPHPCFTHHVRNFSTEEPEDKVKVPSRPRRYALGKVVNYLSNSIDKLENRLPRTYLVYKTLKTGIRSFVGDAKEFYRITKELWSGKSLSELSRKDLEIYRQCSSDLPKMSIALIISLAPGGIFIFPIAYMFPQLLLSHHFWTPQQKEEFQRRQLTKQLSHYSKLLSILERKLLRVPSLDNRLRLQKVLHKLERGQLVSAEETLDLHKEGVFQDRPFAMDFLSLRHRYHLGKSLGLPWSRKQLVRSALLLHFIDMAMIREGWKGMSDEEMDRACMWRGLNPQGLDQKQKMDYLHDWTAVSSIIHEPSVSLFLHLPLLLSYGEPSNRKLLKLPIANKDQD